MDLEWPNSPKNAMSYFEIHFYCLFQLTDATNNMFSTDWFQLFLHIFDIDWFLIIWYSSYDNIL